MIRRTSTLAALVLALGAPAWAAEPLQPPEVCRDDRSSCREDCSLEFGTVAGQRQKLLRCLSFCESAHQACEERYFEAYRQLEEQKKLAEKQKPDPSLPRTRLPQEADRPAPAPSGAQTQSSADTPKSEAPPATTRYAPLPTQASSFSSPEEVEKLSTAPTKPKSGKKAAPPSAPAPSPAPSDLSTWDPARP